MKLVIQTQYRENYGSALAPYWKMKGGDTYIVANISDADAERIRAQGMPTLKAMIEYKNPMSEEYILGNDVVDDDAVVCEEWESPTLLSWSRTTNRWQAQRVTLNDELGVFRKEIKSRIESWDMMMGAERENYNCTYVLTNGKIVKSSDISAEFA
jgi:hypothetical protein